MDNVARTDLLLKTPNSPKTNKSHTPPSVLYPLTPGGDCHRVVHLVPPPDSLGHNISIKRETEMAMLWFTHLKNLRSIDDQTQMLFFKENISH